MKHWRGKLERLFGCAERSIALIDRCRPLNAQAELHRLTELWKRARPDNPAWVYAARPDFSSLRAELAELVELLQRGDPVDRLYAERARELELEARMAEAIGDPRLPVLARQRYAPQAPDEAIEAQARSWSREASGSNPGERFRSDDASCERSLLSLMLRAVRRSGAPIRVVVKKDLLSVAAAGDQTVLIKPDVPLSYADGCRIVVHELLGHVLPRVRAVQSPLGLLRVGSAGAADDEEGRALLLERRFGLQGPSRQAELGQRHLAALSVIDGADWIETVRLLCELGAGVERAIGLACRVHRGGGLVRELAYLPALARVERAFRDTPELEIWLRGGRVGVEAARRLRLVWPTLIDERENDLSWELVEATAS